MRYKIFETDWKYPFIEQIKLLIERVNTNEREIDSLKKVIEKDGSIYGGSSFAK
jgi:hypothetical protein